MGTPDEYTKPRQNLRIGAAPAQREESRSTTRPEPIRP